LEMFNLLQMKIDADKKATESEFVSGGNLRARRDAVGVVKAGNGEGARGGGGRCGGCAFGLAIGGGGEDEPGGGESNRAGWRWVAREGGMLELI
jgi:hypothetical protein